MQVDPASRIDVSQSYLTAVEHGRNEIGAEVCSQSVENLISPWNGYSRAKNRPAEQKRERFHAPSPDRSQEFNLLSDICGEHHRLRL